MKNKFIIIVLLLCTGYLIAQDQCQYRIQGQVMSMLDSSAVPVCKVALKLNGSNYYETKTDSFGYYRFCLNEEKLTTAEVYTIADKHTTTAKAKYGFLASDDHALFSISDSLKNTCMVKNFRLQPIMICIPLSAPIYFIKNSGEYDTVYDSSCSDTTMCFTSNILKLLAQKLIKEPAMVVEISAHASSDEKFPVELSMLRAEKIYIELINLGVNKSQLKPKAYGISKLKFADKVINKEKTKSGKAALHAINRRVVFKILSWEFDEAKK